MPTTATTTTSNPSYIENHLPPSVREKLEAGAFRSLCDHLKERSDEVQNIDLMTLSGFCRNCLAKWMVLEARRLVEEDESILKLGDLVQTLNALGYDQAAQYVYGCDYADWKKTHSKKATDEQMQRYNDSKPLHAKHDKELLAPKGELQTSMNLEAQTEDLKTVPSNPLLSNVCCQDVEEAAPATHSQSAREPTSAQSKSMTKDARSAGSLVPPALPNGDFTFAIVTVSDRASQGKYETGDLGGPAIREKVDALVSTVANTTVTLSQDVVIVPDDIDAIQTTVRQLASNENKVDLILTTGGTGFATRDVTPEATIGVVDRECPGLMHLVTQECSKQQPLASLSRGTAGIVFGPSSSTLICNLPGNPKAVEDILPLLLPLALNIVEDLKLTK